MSNATELTIYQLLYVLVNFAKITTKFKIIPHHMSQALFYRIKFSLNHFSNNQMIPLIV